MSHEDAAEYPVSCWERLFLPTRLPRPRKSIGKRAVYTLVSLLCDEEISPGSTVSSSLGLYMFPFPEPEALGVGATKADCHKTESPTELVGQSLNHKHLELLRLLSY